MTDDARRVVVPGGDGAVARSPGILCATRCPDAVPVRALLQICREAAGAETGRILTRRLAMWLGGTDAPPDTLVFGTATGDGDAAAVFVPVRSRRWSSRVRRPPASCSPVPPTRSAPLGRLAG